MLEFHYSSSSGTNFLQVTVLYFFIKCNEWHYEWISVCRSMVRWEIARWFCYHQANYLCVYSTVVSSQFILILSIDSWDSTWWFVLLSFRWNYSIAHHCSDAPRRRVAPTRRDGAFSAQRSTPVAADWCYHVERPTWAAEHVKFIRMKSANEICDLPAHALPARRTCQCSDCAVKRQQSKRLMCKWL